MLSDMQLLRYTPPEKLLRKFHELDGSTNERTYEWKDENYILIGINAGGITNHAFDNFLTLPMPVSLASNVGNPKDMFSAVRRYTVGDI